VTQLGPVLGYGLVGLISGFIIGAVVGALLYVLGFLPCVLFSGGAVNACLNLAGPVIVGLGIILGLIGLIIGVLVGILKKISGP
jgi:hypothetical protein